MRRLKFSNAVKLGVNGLLQKVPGSKRWTVKTPFIWYFSYEYKHCKFYHYEGDYIENQVIVPVGFKTDLGSIPRLFWIFFDKSRYVSFILHDHIYKYQTYNRYICDKILHEALIVEGASKLEARLIYFGVRIGGFVGYYFTKLNYGKK